MASALSALFPRQWFKRKNRYSQKVVIIFVTQDYLRNIKANFSYIDIWKEPKIKDEFSFFVSNLKQGSALDVTYLPKEILI